MNCNEHGPAQEAFVCEHLLKAPHQLWCSSAPSTENPHPDSWCLECDRVFQEQGEWNQRTNHSFRSSSCVTIATLVCDLPIPSSEAVVAIESLSAQAVFAHALSFLPSPMAKRNESAA